MKEKIRALIKEYENKKEVFAIKSQKAQEQLVECELLLIELRQILKEEE